MSIEAKKQAALFYALAMVRGLLTDPIDQRRAAEILKATSLDNIAESIGLTADDFDADWDEILTDDEIKRLSKPYWEDQN